MLDDAAIELNYHNQEAVFDWQRVFGDAAPVEIEIGFGKCGFLIGMAADQPDRHFVGIETSRKYYRKGIRKIQRADLSNVKLLLGEALHLFGRYIPENSLAGLHINFPDPWPKKRHAKRRLLSPEFVEVAAQRLLPAANFALATDMEAYMIDALVALRGNTQLEEVFATNSRECEMPRRYSSEYERDFFSAGKTLYYATFRKKS